MSRLKETTELSQGLVQSTHLSDRGITQSPGKGMTRPTAPSSNARKGAVSLDSWCNVLNTLINNIIDHQGPLYDLAPSILQGVFTGGPQQFRT